MMGDFYSDSRPRPNAQIDYEDGRGRSVSFGIDEPNQEALSKLLSTFLRLCERPAASEGDQ